MHTWQLTDRTLAIGTRPLVMGILNVTPDSFSDGGRFLGIDAARARAEQMVADGADILDVGGESTRPGSQPVPVDEELRRVLPVVEALAPTVGVPISLDTSKPAVARAGLAAGAHVLNDVTALADPEMVEIARTTNAGVVLMHMQGTPQTMQAQPTYANVVDDIVTFLEARLHALARVGIAAERLVLDPGIGFGKTRDHNLELLVRLGEFQKLGRPVCLGVSRKGFLGKLLERPVHQRLAGSLAAACLAAARGAAQIVRVHDVRETRDAMTVCAALADFAAARGIDY